MNLLDYCTIIVECFGLGDSELYITRHGEGGYAFQGTFNDFLRKDNAAMEYMNSTILALSTMPISAEGAPIVYRVLASI